MARRSGWCGGFARLTRAARRPVTLVAALAVTIIPAARPAAQTSPAAGVSAGSAQREGGRPAGAPRINALVVSGGCCHDYSYQGRMLMDAVSRVLPVDWTVAYQGSTRSTTTRFPIYRDDRWAEGYDIVVHNECSADVADETFIRRITSAHRAGVPALVIHCAMHSYRTAAVDDWREFLGVTSRRHTASHRIAVRVTAGRHPVLLGFAPDWLTPVDELYVIDRLWPTATPLASAVSPEDGREYPLAWVNDYHGARVFGTTLGHGNDTWADPAFQDLIARGFRWAVGR